MSNLANHLDEIRRLNGGEVSPVYNNYVHPADKKWLKTFFEELKRDPRLGYNSKRLTKQLRWWSIRTRRPVN